MVKIENARAEHRAGEVDDHGDAGSRFDQRIAGGGQESGRGQIGETGCAHAGVAVEPALGRKPGHQIRRVPALLDNRLEDPAGIVATPDVHREEGIAVGHPCSGKVRAKTAPAVRGHGQQDRPRPRLTPGAVQVSGKAHAVTHRDLKNIRLELRRGALGFGHGNQSFAEDSPAGPCDACP